MTENYDKLKAQKDAIIAKQTVGTLHAHNEHQATCPHCQFANSEALALEARARRLEEALNDLRDWAVSNSPDRLADRQYREWKAEYADVLADAKVIPPSPKPHVHAADGDCDCYYKKPHSL